MYLVIKNNGLKSYYNTSTCNKPRLVYKTGNKEVYVPLTTSTYKNNNLMVSNYRAMEYASTSGSTTYGTSFYTRVSTSSVYNHTTTSSDQTYSSSWTAVWGGISYVTGATSSDPNKYQLKYRSSSDGGDHFLYMGDGGRSENDWYTIVRQVAGQTTYVDRWGETNTGYKSLTEWETYKDYSTWYQTYTVTVESYTTEVHSTMGGVKTVTTSRDYYTRSSSYNSYYLTSSYSYETWR